MNMALGPRQTGVFIYNMTMVTMVTIMTSNQSHESDQKFRSNLKEELKTLERRRAYRSSVEVGRGGVLYFGPYLGSLLVFAGILDLLSVESILRISFTVLVSLVIMIVGSFVIVASLFAAKVVIPLEVEPRE